MRSELRGKDDKIEENAENGQENVAKWNENTKIAWKTHENQKHKIQKTKNSQINIAPFV